MILNSPTISGSLTVTGNTVLSGSINVVGGLTGTASFASTAISSSYSSTATSSSYALATTSASYSATATSSSYALASTTASYGLNALTSSNSMTASSADTLYVRNNATVLGSITAQTLVVQTVTSSVLFTTGSNKIGSSLSNVQELTGSVGITGSLAVNGAATVGSSVTATSTTATGGFMEIQGSVNAVKTFYVNRYGVANGSQHRFRAENGYLEIASANSENIVLTGGNVGIGTTAPGDLLTVVGSSLYPRITIQSTNAGSSAAGVNFADSSGTQWAIAYDKSGGGMQFFREGGGTRMYITNAGLVGIGTNSPTRTFQMTSTSTAFINAEGSIVAIGSSNADLRLFGNNTETMTIASGSVGIGTTSPDSGLNINSGATRALRIDTNSGVQGISLSPNSVFGIDEPGVGNGRFVINTNGRVGIGTGSPQTTLDVSGTTRITGGGRLYMNNSVMLGWVLQHGDLANGDGSNTVATDTLATNGTAKKRASGASSNTFFYGPYTLLPAGNYVAGFRMKVANNSSSSRIVSIDVTNVVGYSGANALAPNNFASSDAYQYFKIYFTVNNPSAEIEFRALSFVSGITDIYLDHILIMPNLMV